VVIADNLYKKHYINDSDFINAFGFIPSDDSSAVIIPVKKAAPISSTKRRGFY
jgi:hypothetical protein